MTHSAESVLAQTDRVLASPHFSRSPTLGRLLRFVVALTIDGKEAELKEYRLGVDVLGRGADFDPRIDPIVRMQAAKLRSRLAEYYGSDGRDDAIVIAVPKGGYVPTFSDAKPVSSTSVPVAAAAQELQSIAVLPFVSMSADPENEYFSDGLTEELINVLAYVPGLRVVARTSVFCFKNSAQDIRDIGAKLNVQTVLEGSVRRSGTQLRVTAQLIDVATGYHLMSRTFPRELRDVFAVQEELAGAVVAEIMPQVRAEAPPMVRNLTPDLDAYNLYLKGMYTLATRFLGARECIDIFRQALDRDPNYAAAWAGMANAYAIQAWYGMMPSKSALPLSRHAALKALEIDDTNGLAHAILGQGQAILDWDWAGAERSFRRAVQTQPSLAAAHEFYAFTCLLPQQRFEEGIAATERALALNPYDPLLSGGAMFTYAAMGNFEAAKRRYEVSLQAHPHHPLTYGGAGVALQAEGRLHEAIALFRKAVEFSHRAHFPLASLANALASAGETAEARAIRDELLATSRYGFALALVHLGLGEHAEAIRWLGMGMEQREAHLVTVPFDARFRVLRGDPAFQKLMEQMGVPRAVAA